MHCERVVQVPSYMFIHQVEQDTLWFLSRFSDGIRIRGGVAGFFARNTVRTAFNARTSSTTLNVVTANIATFCQLWFPCDWYVSVHRLYSQPESS